MMDDPRAWTMKIDLYGESFKALQGIAEEILGAVAQARSFKELPIGGSSSGGGLGVGYSVTYTCPVETRIKQLRLEADELEASLQKSEQR